MQHWHISLENVTMAAVLLMIETEEPFLQYLTSFTLQKFLMKLSFFLQVERTMHLMKERFVFLFIL